MELSKAELRKQEMRQLLNSTHEIEVGSIERLIPFEIPFDRLWQLAKKKPADLASAQKIVPEVCAFLAGGLTGMVYKICPKQGPYDLAVKVLKSIPYENPEIQASFITELLRKQELDGLQLRGIPQTLYASRQREIIISEWMLGASIESRKSAVAELSPARMQSCLELILTLELHGLFDWDLNCGNVLYDDDDAYLFDFGYMYPFDPCTEFNPNGQTEPFFSMFERFRDNNLFHHLTALERAGQKALALNVYKEFLKMLPALYRKKAQGLKNLGAGSMILTEVAKQEAEILALFDAQGDISEECLQKRSIIDTYYSYKTTIEDNRLGHYFDEVYLIRCQEMGKLLQQHYELLAENGVLLFDDVGCSQSQLLKKYADYRTVTVPKGEYRV